MALRCPLAPARFERPPRYGGRPRGHLWRGPPRLAAARAFGEDRRRHRRCGRRVSRRRGDRVAALRSHRALPRGKRGVHDSAQVHRRAAEHRAREGGVPGAVDAPAGRAGRRPPGPARGRPGREAGQVRRGADQAHEGHVSGGHAESCHGVRRPLGRLRRPLVRRRGHDRRSLRWGARDGHAGPKPGGDTHLAQRAEGGAGGVHRRDAGQPGLYPRVGDEAGGGGEARGGGRGVEEDRVRPPQVHDELQRSEGPHRGAGVHARGRSGHQPGAEGGDI
mmetsp:Transcript_16247/g.35359  ORF Transcript_16247/g.35359 Transcript_16247/m.35359 type:complete len:277 (-) Transcript_16247:992-1822(-)